MRRVSAKRVAMKFHKQAGILKAPLKAEKEILDWVLAVRAATNLKELRKKLKVAVRNEKNIDLTKKALRSTNHKLAYQMYLRVAKGIKELVYSEVRRIRVFSVEDFEALNNPIYRIEFLEEVYEELEKASSINGDFTEDFKDLERLSSDVKPMGSWAKRDFEFDLTKEKEWYFSEDQIHSFEGGKVKMRVEIFPLNSNTLGRWWADSNTMQLSNKFVNDLSIPKEEIRDTIRHELMHFTQSQGDRILSLNRNFGMPSRSISTPEYRQHSSRDLTYHHLDDRELFTDLVSSFNHLRRFLRLARTESEKRELFKEAVGASKTTIHTLPFFKNLKKYSLPKWKRMVSEAYLEVM